MSYYFNTNFLTRLQNGTAFSTSVVVYLFEQAPTFDAEEPPGTGMLTPSPEGLPTYMSIDFPSVLEQQLGWGHAIKGPVVVTTQGSFPAPNTTTKFVSTTTPEIFDLADTFPTTMIRALVFCENLGGPAMDKIMFATTTPLRGGMVLNHWDSIMPQLDTGTTPDATVLFTYLPVVAPSPQLAKEGDIRILKGTPSFDSARTQHVWVYPQRTNFICNPSFEGLPLTNYWRSNGTLAQTTPAPPGSGVSSGRVSGTGPLVLESNFFPLATRRQETGWTIQLKARCDTAQNGRLKVALLTWEDDFSATNTDWGTEEWSISGGFAHIRTMRRTGETATGQLRIEVMGCTYFDIDQVCVEPGLLPTNGNDWPYFDGDSLYDNEGDYSWYGQPAWANATYSCWYNFRYPTFGRLFSESLDTSAPSPGAVFTEVDEAQQGSVYQWVPAGTQVEAHLDVLYVGDPRTQPLVLSSATVHAYKDPVNPTTTPLGVVPPTWAAG